MAQIKRITDDNKTHIKVTPKKEPPPLPNPLVQNIKNMDDVIPEEAEEQVEEKSEVDSIDKEI